MTKLSCLWENDDRQYQPPCTFGKWFQSSAEVDFDQAFGDTEMVQIFAQNGLLNWLFKHPVYASRLHALGLDINQAFGCLSNFIFQAGPELQQQLPENLLQTLSSETVIGVQVRCALTMLWSDPPLFLRTSSCSCWHAQPKPVWHIKQVKDLPVCSPHAGVDQGLPTACSLLPVTD